MAEQQLPNPIREVSQTYAGTTYNGRFGASAADVQIVSGSGSSQEKCSVLDFYNNWKDFKNNNAFMYHGQAKTLNNSVKFWYGENALQITEQPEDVTISAIGEEVSFHIDVTASSTPNYRWQYSTDRGVTWKNLTITTADTNTLTMTSTTARLKWWVRCRVTFVDNKTTEYSNRAQIILLDT